MSIFIYNSLTRKKEPFEPLSPKEIRMYVCGPTVYDDPHIGHARSAYIFDVIRHYLIYKGYQVKFVRNVTDVDDKIIEKARNEYKGDDLNTACKKVADKYLGAYHDALNSLAIVTSGPDILEPKASEYIGKMIEFIKSLIDREVAYQSGGDVYFDITKAKDYGKLSNQSLEKMEIGARVAPTENKRNPLDFALWKSAKESEPSWDSPWGKGRPGWHIECSVMSSDILGDQFDIHGGGIDLIFPHHENEIAQSEGVGKKFAKYWIHHGLLTINGQKMAKSLGNFVTIKDFLAKYKDANLLKLFLLATHYSHPVDYTEEKIKAAKKQKRIFGDFFDKVNSSTLMVGKQKPILSEEDKSKIDNICQEFEKAMDDDFNTPKAVASLFELTDFASAREGSFDYGKSKLESLFNIFGIKAKLKIKLPKEIERKIRERDLARENKDFKKADQIRKEIERGNFLVVDTGSATSCISGFLDEEQDDKEENNKR